METLLERDDALTSLAASLERVRVSGTGEIALIGGEAGVGKTSLVRAFTAELTSAEVLWGWCDGLRTPRPLGPLLDMAAGVLDATVPRDELFAAMVHHLATVRQPVVAVVEDAHWADDATLDFLTFLARRIRDTRALLIVTYRDDEVGARHRLRVVLGDMAVAVRERTHLAPLSIDAVAVLAAGHPVDVAELHARTGGNPFYVTESIEASTVDVPASVRDAVLARAARLSTPARDALEALAVVPGGGEIELVDDPAALDECVDHGIVVALGGRVALRHELARLAVVDAIAPARRRLLHRRALAALAGSPETARLAYHAREAGDDDALLAYAPLAAEQATAAGAHREAVAHLEDAMRVAAGLPLDERARLLERFGDELAVVSRLDDGIAALDDARACWHELGDQRQEARMLVKKAHPLHMAAHAPEAIASIHEALGLLEPLGPGPELAEAYTMLAGQLMLNREFVDAIPASYRAERMAGELGEDAFVSLARIQGGIAQLMMGDDDGLARIHAGIDVARELGLDHRIALGYMQIGSGMGEVRRYDIALPALHECIALCRERDLLATELYATAWVARCALDQGRWDEAGPVATAVVANARTTGIARFVALNAVGRLRARRGDPEIWSTLDEALQLARQTQHLQRLWPIAATRAEAAWLGGRLADEAALVAEVFDLATSLAFPWAVGELGFWLWRAGRLDGLPPIAVSPFALHAAGRFADAAAAWRALGCPYEAADALADSADVIDLRDALATYQSLGARPAASRVAASLRSLGERVSRGPNRATSANPGGMTDRELEVLALVAEGLSNRELAVRLCITEKTAGHHVSHILAKLGATNRSEATAVAARMGIVPGVERRI